MFWTAWLVLGLELVSYYGPVKLDTLKEGKLLESGSRDKSLGCSWNCCNECEEKMKMN